MEPLLAAAVSRVCAEYGIARGMCVYVKDVTCVFVWFGGIRCGACGLIAWKAGRWICSAEDAGSAVMQAS